LVLNSDVLALAWRLKPAKAGHEKPAKPGFLHGFPKPVALALIFKSGEPWLVEMGQNHKSQVTEAAC
jgi:hypothetical protein